MEELRKIRWQKLQKVRKANLKPFAQPRLRKVEIAEIRKKELGTKVEVVGRIRALRAHGGSAFIDLFDESAKIQLFLSEESLGKEKFSILEFFDIGDFISAEGQLFETEAGELTVKVSAFELLTKSLRPLPSSFYGLKDVEERYRQRYLDLLINPEVKRTFEIRSQTIKELRRALDAQGFTEVETPILQTLYGGATAKPFVTHHNALNTNLYLRVSDELYLKRLIVGGFEKVYELSKDFRNEGIDKQHNPEFTMLEFYWAYQTYEGLMEFTEKLLSETIKAVLGSLQVSYDDQEIDFTPPWPRISFREMLIKACGLDIHLIKTEREVLDFIREENISLDLEGVVGLAPLLDTLYKKVARPNLTGPLFLVDHPYQMKPLAKRKEADPTKAASFQLLVLGSELINAYDELNDPLDQRQRWEEELRLASQGLAEYQVVDEDYLRALEYGMPPTAGWGLGVDRLVSILTNHHSIKEVILFPTLRPEKLESGGQELGGGAKADESKKTSDMINHIGDGLLLEPEGGFPNREKVLEFVEASLQNKNLIRHCLAVEAAMRTLAKKFGGNGDLWGVLGLIHDADWEKTKTEPENHTRVTLAWLEKIGYNEGPLVQALKSHNRKHTQLGELESIMEWTLECCDELTGFIVSVALVRPDKKLASVEVDHVLKKWKEKSFAAAVDRSQVEQCQEKLGVGLNEFIGLTLRAMQAIASDLGL